MKITVVVAKYKEDVAWIQAITALRPDVEVVVYDKSGAEIANAPIKIVALPNVGREAHTFLTHIVRHYDDLPDYVMFLQGNPFDHLVTIEDIGHHLSAREDKLEFSPLQALLASCDAHGGPDHKGLELAMLMKKLVGREVHESSTSFLFTPGAQFIASRACLQKHPAEYWRELLELCETREWFPWELERLWFYILGSPDPIQTQ